MVFADWTSGTTKYNGTSRFRGRCHTYSSGGPYYAKLQHNTFLQNQAQLIFWARSEYLTFVNPYAGHVSYGNVPLANSANDTWERFRVTFWYDATTNTKWGRGERWSGSAWVQIGSDVNFGVGSPSNGSIYLMSYTTTGGGVPYYKDCWFDELEVYS